jgi:hypothetical protein
MKEYRNTPIARSAVAISAIGAAALLLMFSAQVRADDLDVSAEVHLPQLQHVTQEELNKLVGENSHAAFEEAFEVGDALFATAGNELDGVGAQVGNGSRFAKHPRADLKGPTEWFNHSPPRATGPNSQACNECHFRPAEDGSGPVSANNVRDPKRMGNISEFITRQPPHIFGIGAKQRLAEEMTQELQQIRDSALEKANNGKQVKAKLVAKGIDFGRITVGLDGIVDYSEVEGVDHDLVIKPLQWKGINFTIRDFVRGAENNELGLQAVEVVGTDKDGDFDGIVDELTVGDMTALAIYQAGQPRPVTKIELADLGLMLLSDQERKDIAAGEKCSTVSNAQTVTFPNCCSTTPSFPNPASRQPTATSYFLQRMTLRNWGWHRIRPCLSISLRTSWRISSIWQTEPPCTWEISRRIRKARPSSIFFQT